MVGGVTSTLKVCIPRIHPLVEEPRHCAVTICTRGNDTLNAGSQAHAAPSCLSKHGADHML
jgi:hypothetical protein